jgi:hypothetical protein
VEGDKEYLRPEESNQTEKTHPKNPFAVELLKARWLTIGSEQNDFRNSVTSLTAHRLWA